MWTKSVFSTMAVEIGYDPETHLLYVTFNSGRTGVYEGVPESVALDLSNAPSVGQYMQTEIKPYYPFKGYR